jgi:hypothetical protein
VPAKPVTPDPSRPGLSIPGLVVRQSIKEAPISTRRRPATAVQEQEQSMTAIVSQVEVEASQDKAFAYVTDPARFSEWQQNVTRGQMDAGHTGVGSICSTTRRIGGAERDVTSKVTKHKPPTSWAVHGIDGPVRAAVDVTVEPLTDPNRSRVTISLDFEGHGIGKLLVPLLVRPQSRKEMQGNMARLKTRLDGLD